MTLCRRDSCRFSWLVRRDAPDPAKLRYIATRGIAGLLVRMV